MTSKPDWSLGQIVATGFRPFLPRRWGQLGIVTFRIWHSQAKFIVVIAVCMSVCMSVCLPVCLSTHSHTTAQTGMCRNITGIVWECPQLFTIRRICNRCTVSLLWQHTRQEWNAGEDASCYSLNMAGLTLLSSAIAYEARALHPVTLSSAFLVRSSRAYDRQTFYVLLSLKLSLLQSWPCKRI